MKKLLLIASLAFVANGFAQNLYTYGFTTNAAMIGADGWIITNQSVPVGSTTWNVPAAALAGGLFGGAGHSGGATSYAVANYNNTTGANTISNWLISPVVNVKNGDVVTFWTRIGKTAQPANFADNLQMRMSTAATTVNPSTGNADLGSFTTLGVEINPLLDTTTFPAVWTQYSYTVAGVPVQSPCKFAFRYFVTDGGPTGNNSDIMGIDDFSVDRSPLAIDTFVSSKFSVTPNPANDFVNVSNTENIKVSNIKITDLNGRVVKQNNFDNVSSINLNVSDLSSGVYMMNINTNEGMMVKKIIKN